MGPVESRLGLASLPTHVELFHLEVTDKVKQAIDVPGQTPERETAPSFSHLNPHSHTATMTGWQWPGQDRRWEETHRPCPRWKFSTIKASSLYVTPSQPFLL